jgi:hypothetical protein
MHRFIAFIALSGFVLSVVVHIVALLGRDVSAQVPLVWSLHLGIFVVFIPFVLSSRKVLGPKPSLAELREIFPGWVVALGGVIFAYAILNFLLFMLATQGGSPSIHDGNYVLEDHGRLIRTLSASEYASFKANEIRGFSGHWLVFYFVPFAYFMFRKESNSSLKTDAPKDGARLS